MLPQISSRLILAMMLPQISSSVDTSLLVRRMLNRDVCCLPQSFLTLCFSDECSSIENRTLGGCNRLTHLSCLFIYSQVLYGNDFVQGSMLGAGYEHMRNWVV